LRNIAGISGFWPNLSRSLENSPLLYIPIKKYLNVRKYSSIRAFIPHGTPDANAKMHHPPLMHLHHPPDAMMTHPPTPHRSEEFFIVG